jgi:hypothetical protein
MRVAIPLCFNIGFDRGGYSKPYLNITTSYLHSSASDSLDSALNLSRDLCIKVRHSKFIASPLIPSPSHQPHQPMIRSHLTVLETSASLFPSSSVFKTPRLDLQSGQVQDWHSITYRQFQSDVEVFARYWTRKLKSEGILQRSVVGLW